MSEPITSPVLRVGRYALYDEIARGGMATVHIGRLLGAAGFARVVAVKRLHPHLAKDATFVAMLLDEARLAGRIQHPNVAATLDVIATEDELFVVMEYLPGETLARLLRTVAEARRTVPPDIASAIGVGLLRGLHAAHEARGERGEPLELVHRDVSPQNVMVRSDGQVLVLDFGVAKAQGRFQVTEEGNVKGKLPYMAPEQVRGLPLTRRVDLYAAGAVLWETLTVKRLFGGANEGEVLHRLLFGEIEPVRATVPEVPEAVDAVLAKALQRTVEARFATAAEMADALEEAQAPASPAKVARWLESLRGNELSAQAGRVMAIASSVVDTGDLETPALPSLLRDKIWPVGQDSEPAAIAEGGDEENAPGATPVTEAVAAASSTAHAIRREPAALAGDVTLVAALGDLPPSGAPKRRSRLLPLVAMLALAVVSIAVVSIRVLGEQRPSPVAAALALASTSPSSSGGGATPSVSTIASVASPASVAALEAKPPASAVATSTAKIVPPKKACSPVTIDAAGRKHFNPSCIQ
jgi:serine/threonine-protein kinase